MQVVDAYRVPQLCRGWELGLCRFVEARLAHVSWSDLFRPWAAPGGLDKDPARSKPSGESVSQ